MVDRQNVCVTLRSRDAYQYYDAHAQRLTSTPYYPITAGAQALIDAADDKVLEEIAQAGAVLFPANHAANWRMTRDGGVNFSSF